MTDGARKAARKLLDKLNREERVAVTVGVAKSNIGNEVLIPFFNKRPIIIPTEFLGFPVLPESASRLAKRRDD